MVAAYQLFKGWPIILSGVMLVGCMPTRTSLYQSWGDQISEMPSHNNRVEDVSMLLGVPPTHCDPIATPKPRIGISVGYEKSTIISVRPNSPADQAGLRPGDSITSINGQLVADDTKALAALISISRVGEPLHLETSRGTLEIIPQVPKKAEQCYWVVEAGQIGRSIGGAYVNQYSGTASSGASTYRRFFRASCRIYNDLVDQCSANWQE